MEQLSKTVIVTKKLCKNCDSNIEHTSCIECGVSLDKLDEYYCSNWGDESVHTCKKCKEINDADCCPKCKSKRYMKWGATDGIDDKTTIIVFECNECKNKWKRIKERYIKE